MSKSEFEKIGLMAEVDASAGKRLRTSTDSVLSVLGVAPVIVTFQSGKHQMSVYVVKDKEPNLLRREWFKVPEIKTGVMESCSKQQVYGRVHSVKDQNEFSRSQSSVASAEGRRR